MVAKQTKNTSKILIELLKLQIGKISERIEREGQTVFGGSNLLEADEIADLCVQFLQLLVALLESRDPEDDASPQFHALEMFFNNLSKQILVRGGRIEDLVRYIQFMQHTLIDALGEDENTQVDDARAILLYLSGLFNELVLAVFQAYLSEKERTIWAQEAELRETSTPITEIWDGVLTLPIIGTLDSSRTMIVMEALLNRIASDHASAVVMDLTGVKNIDSQVSHHLIQMVRAIQLMGADAILTGIRPDIARALTSLNIDLGNVTTRATLSDGLKEAFRRMGIQVSHKAA
ncbi:MAG: STAS domain-containing protein [Sulfurimicrobium sp.]|nr:STAS domain-containing protein [Sulfurimicrobium sp.]